MSDLGPRVQAIEFFEQLGITGTRDALGHDEWAGEERWMGASKDAIGGEVIGKEAAILKVTLSLFLAGDTLDRDLPTVRRYFDYFAPDAYDWFGLVIRQLESRAFESSGSFGTRKVSAQGQDIDGMMWLTIVVEAL